MPRYTIPLTRQIMLGMGALMISLNNYAQAADSEEESPIEMEGALVGSYQTSNLSHVNGHKIRDEASTSLFFESKAKMGPGQVRLQLRGNTSPRSHGITSYYEVNNTVGETVDSNGHGRLAVTELAYELPLGGGDLRVGFLDMEDYIDDVNILNDEYTQFMAETLSTNSVIGVPNYALGIAFESEFHDHAYYKVMASSDGDLQDKNDANYGNVFSVAGHRRGHRKGAFLGAELGWENDGYWVHGGLWYDTGRVDHVRHAYKSENGYGIYGVAGFDSDYGNMELRGGLSNPDAQEAANMISLAYQLPFRVLNHDTLLGVAAARTGDSHALPYHSRPIYQAEAYWRVNIAGPLYISPDIQFVKNADFDPNRPDAVIGGVRASLQF